MEKVIYLADEDSITLGKDALYGILIVILAGLLVVSVFTQGFGIMKTQCPSTVPTVINTTNTTQQANVTKNTSLSTLTVDFGSYPARGNTSAPVAMVEFSEFQCPYCERLYTQTESLLKTNYIDKGKLKLYYRDYPLPPQYHPQAGLAAIAGRCANDQSKFWEMHDKLFDTRSNWSGNNNASDMFKGYAIGLGLNNSTFSNCLDNQSHISEISADLSAGQNYGVTGTPNSFIIIPKSKISEDDARDVVKSVNDQYGEALVLYENNNEYTILIPGAFPYSVFDAILSEVDY
jgi:protein-disulfide isomerase